MTPHDIFTIATLAITIAAFVLSVIVLRRVNRNFDAVIAWAEKQHPVAHYMTMHGKQTKCGVPRRHVREAYESIHRVTCNECRAAFDLPAIPLWETSAGQGEERADPDHLRVLHHSSRFAIGWYPRAQVPSVGLVTYPPPGFYSGVRSWNIHLRRLVIVLRFRD